MSITELIEKIKQDIKESKKDLKRAYYDEDEDVAYLDGYVKAKEEDLESLLKIQVKLTASNP